MAATNHPNIHLVREGVKNILRGGVPRFRGSPIPYSLFLGGAKPFLLFLGGLESNSGILRGGQSFLFIFRGGHEEIAKKCPENGLK